MSSSPYPVLGNQPIDKWRVTELKEELKRRKLPTKGLKDDLIRRLDEALRIESEDNEALLAEKAEAEALRIEKENAEKNVDNGVHGLEVAEPDQTVDDGVTQNDEPDDRSVKADCNESLGEVNEGDTLVGTDSDRVEVHVVSETTVVETVTTISESVISEVAIGGQDLQNPETEIENGNSKPKQEDEGIESTDKMVMPESPPQNNQVSEVSSTLGSQVKSDSISTDSISINEKIELKGNIIADNVKIELDVVKPSSNVDPVDGESHPMDVEEPHNNKTTSVEGEEDDKAASTDLSKKNDSVDVGYSEKLNLDRSSGDDSMEEDLLETKQIDSKDSSDDVVGRGDEKTGVPSANEEASVDIVGDGVSLNKDIHVETMKHTGSGLVNKENPIGMASEKRKLNAVVKKMINRSDNCKKSNLRKDKFMGRFCNCQKEYKLQKVNTSRDQEAIGSAEPLKRQRRWNSESVKVPESQSPNLTPSTTPKNAFQPTALKRNFSISDSKSKDDAPKERVVPPSQKPPTNSLRIDNFLRPFTLKAVQELLGKTGTVAKFWMDQIKTHCFVTYSSVEEATETRNAVYNLQWPPNGGRLLVADFVDPQEVTTRADAPQAPAAPVNPGPTAPPAAKPVPPPHLPAPPRHQPLPLPPPLLPPREQLPLPPPPPPPLVTLDDIFRKTRATPRIYYLPLSEDQVNAKLAAQGKKQDA